MLYLRGKCVVACHCLFVVDGFWVRMWWYWQMQLPVINQAPVIVHILPVICDFATESFKLFWCGSEVCFREALVQPSTLVSGQVLSLDVVCDFEDSQWMIRWPMFAFKFLAPIKGHIYVVSYSQHLTVPCNGCVSELSSWGFAWFLVSSIVIFHF